MRTSRGAIAILSCLTCLGSLVLFAQEPPKSSTLFQELQSPDTTAANRIQLAIGAEEPDDTFGLLEGLDQTVQEHAVEATIVESDVILVMLQEGVHSHLQCGETPEG